MRRLMMALACAALLACGSKDTESAPAPPPNPTAEPSTAAPAPAAPAAPTGPTATGEAFELTAEPSGEYASGQLAQFAVRLEPRAGWKVNQEYPFRIELSANAPVSLPKDRLARTDAAEFNEKHVRFDVPFTVAAPGAHHVDAKVSFSMCTPENCIMERRTVQAALTVR